MYLYFLNLNDGTRSKRAQIDGYSFGDRMLEGVMFDIYIKYNGTLKADVRRGGYVDQLNLDMWFRQAVEFAEGNDIFYDFRRGIRIQSDQLKNTITRRIQYLENE